MIQFTLYQVPLVLSCLASAVVIYSLSKREHSPGCRYLIICILAAFFWALADLFNLGSVSLSNKLFWDNVSYIAIVIFPISWILFVFEYSGKSEYINKSLITLMSSFSLFILVLVWTNQYHYLFRSEIFLVEISGVLSFGKNYGPLFWLFIIYFYVLIIVGSFILFQSFNLSNALNRKQKITFMIAIFFPWISNLLHLSRIITFPLDLTSISFSLMSLVLLIGITKYQLLDIVPTAYMNVFRNMNDGIIVLGRFNQIVEINPYMEKILGVESSKICGKKLNEISDIWPELNNKYHSLSSKNHNNNSNLTKGKNIFEMELSNIYDSKNFLIGYLISLHDITNHKKMEDKLKKSNNQIEDLNETMQVINKILRHDLLNKLTVMKYSLYLYQEKKDKSLIDKIDRSIDGSVELIKRIRELESFILTKEELTPLQIRTVAEEVSTNLNINSININGDATVLADHALFSVFENIMRNALIHGKTDRIDVDINSKNKSCEIRIADYGKGIPEGIKDNIFEEGLSFGDSKGSGLGLYIVKKTIERYGGTISVEGNKPNGAVFIIKMKCLGD
ncbi:MAG: sensory histidine kinase AtoS [Candidatus Methanofastidiosum methylothiophilum]|uniref:histidine kinase n=1 Tax=Candidatus Methanofastidiosum methylothiophilum TaxID=1705564 RepID=A0A150IJ93_9EURY|nr:MAG: sensory histidine kinase AtoS [Candidatus Methanofastidiosum methylthiophilus]KYC48527.1 MAG: sensory histidine kinase AtoS [Candidatus Methanofastidiosum methylthiophilus]KYC51303.1 MAG: sensory histidine kinase AtoS [Candidatus Methanofastidiosum methylthiophilus]